MWYGEPEEENVESLREQLEDYYGTAMQEFPMAVTDLGRIGDMSDEEIVEEAKKAGLIR